MKKNNLEVYYYNNMSLILLTLDPSIALIEDFENWNDDIENKILQYQKHAKENNLKTTLFALYDDETSYGLLNTQNIIKKAKEFNIDYLIFYIVNKALYYMEKDMIFNNLNGFLSLNQIAIPEDFDNSKWKLLSVDFVKEFWKQNCFVFKRNKNNNLLTNLNLLQNSQFGQFKKENNLNYELEGRVCEGQHLGKKLGYPTINVNLNDQLPISKGVFACQILVESLNQTFLGAGCYWTNNLNQDVFEVHLLDFDQEIYGWKVTITVFAKIRENIKPENEQHLKELLQNDVNFVKNFKWS